MKRLVVGAAVAAVVVVFTNPADSEALVAAGGPEWCCSVSCSGTCSDGHSVSGTKTKCDKDKQDAAENAQDGATEEMQDDCEDRGSDVHLGEYSCKAPSCSRKSKSALEAEELDYILDILEAYEE